MFEIKHKSINGQYQFLCDRKLRITWHRQNRKSWSRVRIPRHGPIFHLHIIKRHYPVFCPSGIENFFYTVRKGKQPDLCHSDAWFTILFGDPDSRHLRHVFSWHIFNCNASSTHLNVVQSVNTLILRHSPQKECQAPFSGSMEAPEENPLPGEYTPPWVAG